MEEKNKECAACLKKMYICRLNTQNIVLGGSSTCVLYIERCCLNAEMYLKKFLDIANTGNIQTEIQGHITVITDLIMNAQLHLILYLYHNYESRGDSVPK